MAKNRTQSSRKSRFELLENRHLLSGLPWAITDKFVDNGLTQYPYAPFVTMGNATTDGGEAAFGDSATKTAAQLGHSQNNNYGDATSATYHWTPGATDVGTSTSPWSFGGMSSGPAAFNASTPYTYAAYVDPTTFDPYLGGSSFPFPGAAGDGVSQSVAGLAGYNRGESAVFYNYGNNGLNGNGTGEAVTNPFDSYATIPTGTLMMSSLGEAAGAQFTAPATGTYALVMTLTDPYFDPYDGPTGSNHSNEAWAWDTGQGQFLLFKVNSANNSSSLLASGFPEDIAAVTTVPTVGNTVNASSGLTINSGTATGAFLNSHDLGPSAGYPDSGLPLAVNNGSQATNLYSYGSGGTWSLKNVGSFASPPANDSTGDEYDLSWTVTQTVSLNAGDKLQIQDNPEWMQGTAAGDYYAPVYLSAGFVEPTGQLTVTTSSNTGQTFTLGGSPVAVDSGVTVSSLDTEITGASMQINNFQTGDVLNFTNQNGITGTYSAGLLTLSGNATPAQYTTALQSVTFQTTSHYPSTRVISVIADDSTASPTTSNTGTDTVNVALTVQGLGNGGQAVKNATAGQTVAIDSVMSVSANAADLTGATVSISNNFQSGDALQFTAQNGITISSNSGGVLTLTGSATPAQYQTALESITYSSTSTSTLTRTVSWVAQATGETGTVTSNTLMTAIAVSAPVAISQVYVNGTSWAAEDTYLGSHDYTTGTNVYGFTTAQNIPYGSSTLGFALVTGANQVKTLPWSTINKIDIQFNGALGSTPAASSFKITGGTGGAGHADLAAISVTSVTSLGGNAYQLSLSASLGYNNYIISVASTGTAFGPAVTDANGAGIAGSWTNSSSTFPSGGPSGLAGSQFNFQIDVLPGDTNQNGQVAANDSAKIAGLLNDKTTGATSASYVPFVDVNANGTIASNDGAVVAANINFKTSNINFKTSNITNPTNPSGGLVGGSGFTALALGVQESGQTSSSPTTSVSNVSSPGSISLATGSVSPAATTSSSTGSGSGSGGSSGASTSTTSSHGRHAFSATDAAVSDFDLAELWA